MLEFNFLKKLNKQAIFSAINWSPIVKGLALGISHGPNVIVITKVTLNAEHYFIALSAHIFCPDFLFAQKNELKSKVGLNQGYEKIGYLLHIKCLLEKVYNSIQPFANSKAGLRPGKKLASSFYWKRSWSCKIWTPYFLVKRQTLGYT